jgi:hypothetical protein
MQKLVCFNEYKLFVFGTIVANGLLNNDYSIEEKVSEIINAVVNYFQGKNVILWS